MENSASETEAEYDLHRAQSQEAVNYFFTASNNQNEGWVKKNTVHFYMWENSENS